MGGHFISWRMSLVLFIYIQKVERETTLERLKQLGRQIKRLIVRQSGSQAGRWTDRKADRQTDRQTRVRTECGKRHRDRQMAKPSTASGVCSFH